MSAWADVIRPAHHDMRCSMRWGGMTGNSDLKPSQGHFVGWERTFWCVLCANYPYLAWVKYWLDQGEKVEISVINLHSKSLCCCCLMWRFILIFSRCSSRTWSTDHNVADLFSVLQPHSNSCIKKSSILMWQT